MKTHFLPLCLGFLLSAVGGSAAAAPAKPNVLFIAIDDLNDWAGCLGGHPQARTPNLDRLAASGVLFTNAHCPAPWCNPSRTGLRPATTGVYRMQKFRIFGSSEGNLAVSVNLFYSENTFGYFQTQRDYQQTNSQPAYLWDYRTPTITTTGCKRASTRNVGAQLPTPNPAFKPNIRQRLEAA